MHWTEIDGWLSLEEGDALQVLAGGNVVLELGSYLGRSTVCLASVAAHVTSIDWHQGDADTGPADTLARFRDNLKAAHVEDRVTVVVKLFSEVASALPDASFDLVFIDGQHDSLSVMRDTRLAMRCLKPGGVIVWHDWSYPSVQEVIVACGFVPTEMMANMAWMTFR